MIVTEPAGDAAMKDKADEEVVSTTEEDAGSSVMPEEVSTTDSEEEKLAIATDEVIFEEQKKEALRQYGERFGQCAREELASDVDCSRNNVLTGSKAEPCSQPAEAVLASLDNELAGPRPQAAKTARVQRKAHKPPAGNDSQLMLTFGYAAGLDHCPAFGRFDIRDHICMKVGGFKHGDVVRDRSGGEMVVVGVREADGSPRLWLHPKNLGRPGAGAFQSQTLNGLRQRLTPVPSDEVRQEAPHFYEMRPEDLDAGEDSDGEDVILCRHCKLPVGEGCYEYGNKKMSVPVHSECVKQLVLTTHQDAERRRKQEDAKLKSADRERYNIGWSAREVPLNATPAMQLGCFPAPQGMCCLVYDQEAHSVHVAPTLEPAESVNLEYLSLALRTRLLDGREPFFSLEPTEMCDEFKKDAMQIKHFEPEWLSATSVGEVMFQADYHLKELSMGEYEQPVVGMKSCRDFNEEEEIDDWSAREWFVVRKAEVLITEDGVLVPRVRMGVEAREQRLENDELVDVRCTRPNHPLVKYAEAFSHHFDLIAERKSVIFHLRELARASAMAKMLVDGAINLEGPWLNLVGEVKEMCAMEVPQLWNYREYLKMSVRDGEIVGEGRDGRVDRRHGVYGGVQFGLERTPFSLPLIILEGRGLSAIAARPTIVPEAPVGLGITALPTLRMPSIVMPTFREEVKITPLSLPTTAIGGLLQAPKALAAPPTAPIRAPVKGITPSAGLSAATTAGAPAKPKSTADAKALAAIASLPSGVRGAAVPLAQTSALGDPTSLLAGTDGLQTVKLEKMAPGATLPTRASYVPTSRVQVSTAFSSAERVEARGVDLNLDQFNLAEPTLMEGRSWAHDASAKNAPMGSAFWASLDNSGSEFRAEDKNLLQAIYDPILCDRRQEGEQFIPPDTSYEYVEKLRSLVLEEVGCREQRKQHFCSKDFSMANPGPLFPVSWAPSIEIGTGESTEEGQLLARPDYLVQAQKLSVVMQSAKPTFDRSTEEGVRFRIYQFGTLEVRTTQEPSSEEVIGAVFSTSLPQIPASKTNGGQHIVHATEYVEMANDGRRSFVVLGTEQEGFIVTERLVDGTTTWEENPSDLEDRKALAKVVREADCSDNCVPIFSMQNFQIKENGAGRRGASSSECKHYAHGVYCRAIGKASDAKTGFKKHDDEGKWMLSERKYGLYAKSTSNA